VSERNRVSVPLSREIEEIECLSPSQRDETANPSLRELIERLDAGHENLTTDYRGDAVAITASRFQPKSRTRIRKFRSLPVANAAFPDTASVCAQSCLLLIFYVAMRPD
jgi:hypothetical protein